MPKSTRSSKEDSSTSKTKSEYEYDPNNGFDLVEYEKKRKGIYLIGCRYDVVLRVAMEFHFKIVNENEPWAMCWSDLPLLPDKIAELKRKQLVGGPNSPVVQKFNHFPAMYEICRKDRLGRNLNRFKRVFPQDYNFFPLTWDLPSDISEVTEYWKKHRNTIFIIKPDAGSQGKGIFLLKNIKLLCSYVKCVCQQYISQPLLLDGFKFDLRIYVLVSCVDPLRIYIYRGGIARFATVKYEMPCDANLEVAYMHLTNYNINKFSDDFCDDIGGGTKRPLTEVYSQMCDLGYNVKQLQDDIDEIVIKTIVMVTPSLRHNYRATFPKRDRGCYCYELLGFDILVDRDLKPSLIEVNSSPSYNLDTPADNVIKFNLVRDLFSMIYFSKDSMPPGHLWKSKLGAQDKFNIQRKPGTAFASSIPDALKDQFVHEERNQNNFRLIFTEEDPGKYSRFIDQEYFIMDDDDEDRRFFKKKSDASMSMYSGCSESFHHEAGKMPSPFRHNPIFGSRLNNLFKFKNNYSHFTERTKTLLFRPQIGQAISRTSTELNRTASWESRSSIVSTPSLNTDIGKPPQVPRSPPNPRKFTLVNVQSLDEYGMPILSPSQRVQNALEQLRKKNLEKFKLITQQNQAVLSQISGLDMTQLTQSCHPSSPVLQPDAELQEPVKVKKGKKKSVKFDESVIATNNKLKESNSRDTILPRDSTTSFKPLAMDMREERRRIRTLASRKRALGVFGITDTIRQVVEHAASMNPTQSPENET